MLIDILEDTLVGNVILEFRGKVKVGDITMGIIRIQRVIKGVNLDVLNRKRMK